MMVKRAEPRVLSFVKVVLAVVSFRLGALLLCGWDCCDWKWPFIHNFSELPVERREKILMKWSSNGHHRLPLRAVFALIKTYCLFVFFSMVKLFAFSINFSSSIFLLSSYNLIGGKLHLHSPFHT